MFSVLWPQFCKQFSIYTFPMHATCIVHTILLGWRANITHVFITQFYPPFLSSPLTSRPSRFSVLRQNAFRLCCDSPSLTPILNWQNYNSHLINNHQSDFQYIAKHLYIPLNCKFCFSCKLQPQNMVYAWATQVAEQNIHVVQYTECVLWM
jgi:hypothetical protein